MLENAAEEPTFFFGMGPVEFAEMQRNCFDPAHTHTLNR